ncbi:hypothetical protein [Catellatospora sp. NPDC049609]|uniref:hypothetical protein n=1 Tax=Catellatospora sp. NPDC049609 TaxID=3155505 RepID=UPI0034208F37
MGINPTSKSSVGVAIGGLFVFMVAACGGGLAGGALGLLKFFGETKLGEVGIFAACTALVVSGHAVVCWWAFAGRPARARVAVTQMPFLLTYAVFSLAWMRDPSWPWGYLLWGWAVLAVLGGLTAWRMGASRATANLPLAQLKFAPFGNKSSGGGLRRWWSARLRRRKAYLVAVLVLLGGNLVALGDHLWTRTRRFGLVGGQSPEAAINALEATSCLSELGEWHHKAGHLSEADCPEGESYGLRYQGVHDDDFDSLITSEQPRGAFARWWDVQRDYGYHVTLRLRPKDRSTDGGRAVLTYEVEWASEGRFMPGDRRFKLDKSTETWVVTAVKVPLGGWKVATIDVPDPIGIVDQGVMPQNRAEPPSNVSNQPDLPSSTVMYAERLTSYVKRFD